MHTVAAVPEPTIAPPPLPAPAVPGIPFAGIAYAPPAPQAPYGAVVRSGVSGFGIVSVAACAATLVYTAACAFMMFENDRNRRDWAAAGFMYAGLIGNWVGCGAGLLMGLVGVLQPVRRRDLAARGLVYNGLLALVTVLLLAWWLEVASKR
jgi:hypothetical protein